MQYALGQNQCHVLHVVLNKSFFLFSSKSKSKKNAGVCNPNEINNKKQINLLYPNEQVVYAHHPMSTENNAEDKEFFILKLFSNIL